MSPKLQAIVDVIREMLVIGEELSKEGKTLTFFALFLRDYSQSKWDIVVAAPWVDLDHKAAITLIAQKLNARLSPKLMLLISRIVIINSNNPLIKYYNNHFFPENYNENVVTCYNYDFFGQPINTAFLFRVSKGELRSDEKSDLTSSPDHTIPAFRAPGTALASDSPE